MVALAEPIRTECRNPPTRKCPHVHVGESYLQQSGHRYYGSEMGRWVSRDPVSEIGGANVYAFAGNRVPFSVDLLGLSEVTEWHRFQVS